MSDPIQIICDYISDFLEIELAEICILLFEGNLSEADKRILDAKKRYKKIFADFNQYLYNPTCNVHNFELVVENGRLKSKFTKENV